MSRPDTAALQRTCETFNRLAPIGSEVLVRRDNGTLVRTRTRSAAEVLSGHTAVIWLDGIGGCFSLSRVTPVSQIEVLS